LEAERLEAERLEAERLTREERFRVTDIYIYNNNNIKYYFEN